MTTLSPFFCTIFDYYYYFLFEIWTLKNGFRSDWWMSCAMPKWQRWMWLFFSNEIKPSFILNRLRLDIIIRPMKMVVANGAQSHTPPAKKIVQNGNAGRQWRWWRGTCHRPANVTPPPRYNGFRCFTFCPFQNPNAQEMSATTTIILLLSLLFWSYCSCDLNCLTSMRSDCSNRAIWNLTCAGRMLFYGLNFEIGDPNRSENQLELKRWINQASWKSIWIWIDSGSFTNLSVFSSLSLSLCVFLFIALEFQFRISSFDFVAFCVVFSRLFRSLHS